MASCPLSVQGDIFGGLASLNSPSNSEQKWRQNSCAKEFANHLEERLLDQAQARASYTPPVLGSFA